VDARLADSECIIVSSALTRMEFLIVPLGERDSTLAAEFHRYFRSVVMLAIPLSDAVMDRAAAIRAEFGFRTPDAIHLAAAIEAKCDVFLTNDRRLIRFPGIAIVLVDDLA
jgi:predicted nucleic acid-binding protein